MAFKLFRPPPMANVSHNTNKSVYRSIVGLFRPSTMERIMTKIQALVVSAAVAMGMAAPAQAGVNDPEIIIYRFPGVRDVPPPFGNVATVFHCTNFSGATENVRFVTRNFDGSLPSNKSIAIPHLQTKTANTHDTVAYTRDLDLNTGLVGQGTTAIAATSINVICTAMTIDGSTSAPVGA